LNPQLVTAACNPGGTSTISFELEGTAVGPYPGTFKESGTFTIGPVGPQVAPNPPFGTVLSAALTFTIFSGPTTITGTKTLAVNVSGSRGTCVDALETIPQFCELFASRPGPAQGRYREVLAHL